MSLETISPRRVLLAEDEPMVRKLVYSLLTSDGFEVLPAVDGQEALELSRQFEGTIDLLLTDVVMPRMDGPELVRRIKLDRPGIGVLVMSAYSSGQMERLTEFPSFIRKPFRAKALIRKVQDVIDNLPDASAG